MIAPFYITVAGMLLFCKTSKDTTVLGTLFLDSIEKYQL